MENQNNTVTDGNKNNNAFPLPLTESLKLPLTFDFTHAHATKSKVNAPENEAAWFSLLASILNLNRAELEQREKKRQHQRRRRITAISVSVMMALLFSAIIAFIQRDRAISSQANSLSLVSHQLSLSGYATLGNLLGLTALQFNASSETVRSTSEAAIVASLNANNEVRILDTRSAVNVVQYSPDGKQLAVGTRDSTLAFLNGYSASHATDIPSEKHSRQLLEINYSADNRLLVTGSSDNTGAIWDTETGRRLRLLSGYENVVHEVNFSQSGARVLMASLDGTVKIQNTSDQQTGLVFDHTSEPVFSAHFVNFDNQIVTITWGGMVRL